MSTPSEAVNLERRGRFVKALPKIELHAHLNGSIRRTTLQSLAQERGIDSSGALILSTWPNTLSEAFSVFKVIHSCVTTLQDVERIAFELGQDLEEDGVIYAEIRTTPRRMFRSQGDDQQELSSLEEYVNAVLSGFSRYSDSSDKRTRTILRLILSIDRAKHDSEQALSIVRLAQKYTALSGGMVVGIDLSGDPIKGEFETFLPALEAARSTTAVGTTGTRNLKITLHAGEVSNKHDEMATMLKFHPERFGHCCFASEENLAALKASKIPIELCPTSNLLSNSVARIEDHHFGIHYGGIKDRKDEDEDGTDGDRQELLDSTICCISTDDSGVFGSPLSNEYALVMEGFDLSEIETFRLAKSVLRATFLDSNSTSTHEDAKDAKILLHLERQFESFKKSWDWQ